MELLLFTGLHSECIRAPLPESGMYKDCVYIYRDCVHREGVGIVLSNISDNVYTQFIS